MFADDVLLVQTQGAVASGRSLLITLDGDIPPLMKINRQDGLGDAR